MAKKVCRSRSVADNLEYVTPEAWNEYECKAGVSVFNKSCYAKIAVLWNGINRITTYGNNQKLVDECISDLILYFYLFCYMRVMFFEWVGYRINIKIIGQIADERKQELCGYSSQT